MRQTITKLACAIITLLFISSNIYGQERYVQVKIFPPQDINARSHLIGLLEIDHFVNTQDGAIVSEISESELEVLKGTGYKYKIVIPDVAKRLDSINKIYYKAIQENPAARVAFEQSGSAIDAIIKRPAAFEVKGSFGGYYSFAEMNAAMNTLVATYPSIASKTSLGTTSGGRDIWMIKISDNVATDDANEPELLFMGLQHAREAIGGASMIYLMQYLCEQYGVDSRITQLVNNREFYIIPCFNPDGWEYNRGLGAGSGWRKNRRLISGTTYGVDLNRNWGVDWANCSAPIQGSATSCGSGTASNDTYYGPSAFSEAETQAVRNFTKSKHIVIGFDQHAFGPYYSLPFGRQILHTMPQKGQDFFTTVPALMGKYNAMRAADSYDALGYEVAGGFKDWMLMGELGTSVGSGLKDTVWAMTGEGGAGDGSGGSYGSFWAPAAQIVNLCKGMTYQNLQLAYAAGTYVDVQDSTQMALTGFETKLAFSVKRLGLGNNPFTVTLVPLENMKNIGSPKTISSMVYYGTVTDSIAFEYVSGMTNGQRIKFAWKVDADGITYSDTITKYLNPTVMFSDDMEGAFATNWINRATGTPASGFGYNYIAA
ncbi:MAG: M14 family metallopeptidase, partial [Flavisolibacter sp.]